MLIDMTREIIHVVSWEIRQISSNFPHKKIIQSFVFISLVLCFSFSALGDIAQATVMVHVLIGKKSLQGFSKPERLPLAKRSSWNTLN